MYPPAETEEILPETLPEEDPAIVAKAEADAAAEKEREKEELGKSLLDLLKMAREDDRFVRDDYLRVWKRLEFYWNNILDIFMDPIARDWRVPDWNQLEEDGETPPRLINIYRPHGEAIVAALSVSIPSVVFYPDDADNPDDVEAAKGYRNIVELLALHNEAAMLFIRVITILLNQGTVFGYNYVLTDPKFGTLKIPRIENKEVNTFQAHCPQCGAPMDAGMAGEQQMAYQCPECGYMGPPEMTEGLEILPQIVGFEESPKSSICQELFSGLNVKVPAYVRKQEECGYLLLSFNQSTAMLKSVFSEKSNEIASKRDPGYESFIKNPLPYLGDSPDNTSNVDCLWVRPWQFWQLSGGDVDNEKVTALVAKFPKGCYAIFVNDQFMEAYEEDMDVHWTISKNPMGAFIYGKPLGENLATVQDIRAELVEIQLQTAEYGIPETFVDERVLDLGKYGAQRAQPGMVTGVKPRPGKSIADAFHTTKTAVLSQEVTPLKQSMDTDAQFVLGSFPSVYGGTAEGGSKTASEYAQSKAMALQRLGTTWKIACFFWSTFQARSAVEFANIIKESGMDEKFAKKEGDSFVNVWIRNSSLTGRIGRVEPEATEQLPVSWAQKKEALFQLLQAPIPEILMVLTHPNNADVMKEALGLAEIYIPGEEARLKQQKEFVALSQGIPIQVNPLIDNHAVHVETLKEILEGPRGDGLDPMVMQLCMMHIVEHMQFMEALSAGNPEEDNGSAPEKEPKGKDNGGSTK